ATCSNDARERTEPREFRRKAPRENLKSLRYEIIPEFFIPGSVPLYLRGESSGARPQSHDTACRRFHQPRFSHECSHCRQLFGFPLGRRRGGSAAEWERGE